MVERPTEDTYVVELVSAIKSVGSKLDFDAEAYTKTPSGKPDLKLLYKGKTVAIIEVKRPDISLTDPKLREQALRYAEWYRENMGVEYYGIHNMKYLQLFRYVKPREKREQTTLSDFIEPSGRWLPVSDFPFRIIPWVSSITDYKEITSNNIAKKNLESFLIKFRELLEGKSIDLTRDVIETIAEYIEKGASNGLAQFEQLYKKNKTVRLIFNDWLGERGYQKPRKDDELRKLLKLLLKEQLYTFSMKVLFYLVLQSIDADMASKLHENISKLNPEDPDLFKKVFDLLFQYAIERTGDFEEVFGSNSVDRLPFVPAVVPILNELIQYLNQVRWSDVNVDVIGRIFEGLIHEERRHLLGQHFTETKIVDLILTATLKEPRETVDPSCGSGTFLVRAFNYWRVRNGLREDIEDLLHGVDIDKLAVMLSKINLYIQALEKIKVGKKYIPKVYQGDSFKIDFKEKFERDVFGYVVTNPPYTRQEELAMAYYDKNYKDKLREVVKDIDGWSEKASIYAYFLVKGGKLLKDGGRLGFIVENSWMNADYGLPLKRWLLDNFSIDFVIESLVERWFEDADIITNIIVAEKGRSNDVVNFLFLKKKILGSNELLDEVPPSSDFTANQRYYERIEELLNKVNVCQVSEMGFGFYEDDDVKIVVCKKDLLRDLDDVIGRWGILKGPRKYIELIVDFINGQLDELTLLENVVELRYGLKTNANEIFYLPSKYWKLVKDEKDFLQLIEVGGTRVLKLSKKYLRPLIRPSSIKDSSYLISTLKKTKKEDYVIWVEDVTKIDDDGMRTYLEWAESFVREKHETEGKFPTLFKKISSNTWTKLSDTSGAQFLFKNAIHKNFAIYLNGIPDAQVDKRLFMGYLKEEIDPRIVFASLNSVITYLGMELIGRTNLGQGALDVNITDYNKIPIVDPKVILEELTKKGKLKELLNIVDKILSLKPRNIEEEAKNPLRLKLDRLVLSVVGLNRNDVDKLYKGLLELVKYRMIRSNNKE